METYPGMENLDQIVQYEQKLLRYARCTVQVHDMRIPSRDGETFHFAECHGRGGIGGGLPMVFIHGYGGSLCQYYRMMKFLVERWAGPLFFLDLPGMGASARKERMFKSPVEVERFFARRLRFWCDTILGKDQKFVLVAHSFGAYVGTAFAHTVKERVAAIVLLSPCFGFPKSRAHADSDKGLREHAIEYMMDVFEADGGPLATAKRLGWAGEFVFRKALRSRLSALPQGPELDAFVDHLAYMNCSLPVGTESALTSTFGHYLVTKAETPLIERVDFDVPLISFYGDNDWMDRQGGAYIGDIGVIPGCTHHMHLEFPRLVTRCIMYFLKHNLDDAKKGDLVGAGDEEGDEAVVVSGGGDGADVEVAEENREANGDGEERKAADSVDLQGRQQDEIKVRQDEGADDSDVDAQQPPLVLSSSEPALVSSRQGSKQLLTGEALAERNATVDTLSKLLRDGDEQAANAFLEQRTDSAELAVNSADIREFRRADKTYIPEETEVKQPKIAIEPKKAKSISSSTAVVDGDERRKSERAIIFKPILIIKFNTKQKRIIWCRLFCSVHAFRFFSGGGIGIPTSSSGSSSGASSSSFSLAATASYAANVVLFGGVGYLGKQAYDSQQEAERLQKLSSEARKKAEQSFSETSKLQRALQESERGLSSSKRELEAQNRSKTDVERKLSQAQKNLSDAEGVIKRLLPPPEEELEPEEAVKQRTRRAAAAKAKTAVEDLIGLSKSPDVGPSATLLKQLAGAKEKYLEIAGKADAGPGGAGVVLVEDPTEQTKFLQRVDLTLQEISAQLDALKKLEAAIQKRDKQLTEQRLTECETLLQHSTSNGAGGAVSKEVGHLKHLAELLLAPDKLLSELSLNHGNELALTSFAVADFVQAEEDSLQKLADSALMKEDSAKKEAWLRNRVLNRTQQLAESRKFFGVRLAEEVASFNEKFEVKALEKIGAAEREFEAAKRSDITLMRQEVEEAAKASYDEKLGAELAKTTQKLEDEKQSALTNYAMQAEEEMERQYCSTSFDEQGSPITSALTPLSEQEIDPVLRKMALSGIEKCGDKTLVRGQNEVTKSFDHTIRKWVIASFVEKPNSFWSHLYANVIGRVYSVERKDPAGAAAPAAASAAASGGSLETTLGCLNTAARFVDKGDLRSAILALEGVPESSFLREQIKPWLAEARSALCGELVLKAMQTRLQCLNVISHAA
eukprot:g2404.t1